MKPKAFSPAPAGDARRAGAAGTADSTAEPMIITMIEERVENGTLLAVPPGGYRGSRYEREAQLAAASGLCANCGTPASGRFCPQCGQEAVTVPARLWALSQSAGHGLFDRNGPVLSTFRQLLAAPGALTADFLAGRRARYLRPLPLYLWVSLLVFGGVQFLNLDLVLRLVGDHGLHVVHSSSPGVVVAHAWTPVQIVADHVHTPAVRRFAALSLDEKFDFLRARRSHYVSSMLLLVVPGLAGALALAFRRLRRPLLTHLVFALHTQAFILLALLVQSGLPAGLADAVSWWVLAYFFLALKRVYECKWVGTALRGIAALAGYFAAYYLANLLLVFAMVSA